ncbi:MAG: carboxypeptidase regulatory-like domain-containing protein [Candidatus Solibacter sp.]|nr:carboxypeptidase regulatory-like domain-containing protein [Candidatus Solibacter sp.]
MNAGPLVAGLLAYRVYSTPAWAQRAAFVHGRVLDPSDAAIPEAAITIVNQESGFRRVTRTDSGGDYAVGSLDSGVYKVTVRKDGFRTMIRFNVKVANLEAARVDFTLSVGAVQETITVEDTAPLPGQEDASIGVRVFREDIQRLPLNGRGILGLLELSPGTNVTPATRGEAGQFTANGQRPNANYFTVDGASANTGVTAGGLPAQATGGVLPAMSAFGSLDSLLPVEAVDEFRVQTSNAMSELGRLPGANVALTSRSGSNEFHGSAVYRLRHELLAANDWFANVTGIRRGPLRLHDISPSFGGPIHRDRTFFFLSYQHMALRGSYVSRQPVPSDATRAAAPFWVQPALGLYPQGNGPALGSGLAAWYGRNVRPSQLDGGLARIDHALTSRATLFARYNDSPSFNEFGSSQINRLDLRFQSLTLGLNLRPGTRWTVDLRGNESHAEALSSWARAGQTNASGCDLEPMTSYLFPAAGTCNALLRFSIGGVGQVVTGHEGMRRQRQFQSVGSTAWRAGPHTVRFGADYRRMVPIRRDATGVLSAIADDITSLTDKKNLWLGSSPAISSAAEVTELSLWGQDTWQVSPRILITPGLRWELNPSPAASSTTYFLDPRTGTFFDRNNRLLWPVAYTNFAPRLGVSWRVRKSGRTVFRAGGALFYDSSLSIATDLINSGPFSITQFTNGIHGFVSSLLSYAFSPNLRLPRLNEWNFTLDQALSAHDMLSVGYVGAIGRRLIRREVGGPGNTETALFALTTNNGDSHYQGLQVQYRRRVLQGLQSLVSYSWSHSLDNDSSDASLVWAGPGAGAARDHSSSDFDLRHSLTAALTYELSPRPAGRARWLGGWAIDSLVRVRSGFPVSVQLNEQYQGIALANAFRPDHILNQPIWLEDASVPAGQRLNRAAFQPAKAGTQGTLGRNSIPGFAMGQLDLAVRREFRLRDRKVVQVRLEAFNTLNQANFADPVKFLSSAVFGQSTSMLNLMLGTGSPGSGLSPILQTGGPRSLQGSIRFRF